MKKFDIPEYYRSSIISEIKEIRRRTDHLKKDFSPTVLDFEGFKFFLPRHFGFCFGVQNAVEIAYKAIAENPNKNIYVLSEMIHNPVVNQDLEALGLRFIMDTKGNQLLDWNEVHSEDIVVIPAFGASTESIKILVEKGVDVFKYDTTCPFVTKVWNRSESLVKEGYTIILHGKESHEETKATFSRISQYGPCLVIRNLKEAELLSSFILGKVDESEFLSYFKGRYSEGFLPTKDLVKLGVVNQTTMLASETKDISEHLKSVIVRAYDEDAFADNRDTLCYATNDNQSSTLSCLSLNVDLVIVVGGVNSSNTKHLYQIFDGKYQVLFVRNEDDILSDSEIISFDLKQNSMVNKFIDLSNINSIILASGASCPDFIMEKMMRKILKLKGIEWNTDLILEQLNQNYGI